MENAEETFNYYGVIADNIAPDENTTALFTQLKMCLIFTHPS